MPQRDQPSSDLVTDRHIGPLLSLKGNILLTGIYTCSGCGFAFPIYNSSMLATDSGLTECLVHSYALLRTKELTSQPRGATVEFRAHGIHWS